MGDRDDVARSEQVIAGTDARITEADDVGRASAGAVAATMPSNRGHQRAATRPLITETPCPVMADDPAASFGRPSAQNGVFRCKESKKLLRAYNIEDRH